MVLVDTTVWIDFFSAQSEPHVEWLENLIAEGDDVCVCGVILAEVLQGIRKDSDHRKTTEYFRSLILLPMRRTTFEKSAALYRSLRKKGVTVRKPVDCMIAAVAMEQGISLLHNDRDFLQIAKHSRLNVLKP